MKIAIAGSFGFIGQHLIAEIMASTDYSINALSRSARVADNDRIHCVKADLYSLKDAKNALRNCDVGIYLVHSMAPSSRLSQGSFRDFDFILADNFSRAAKYNNVKHIIYVGGMIPEREVLSTHLQSRLEVEDVLRSHGVPVTAFRCSLVIGPKGSSFSIVVRLIERLPIMILPKWMRTLSNPIYVGDLTRIIVCSAKNRPTKHEVIDAGMDQDVSYKDIVIETSRQMQKNPWLIDVPYVSPRLSKLWVTLVSGAPRALVYPLIDSVRHEMLKDASQPIPAGWQAQIRDLQESVQATFKIPFVFKVPKLLSSVRSLSEVRSVQRMLLPLDRSASWVAREYMNWLPVFLKPFIKVVKVDAGSQYRLRFLSVLLLSLKLDKKISHDKRQLYRVGSGLLVAAKNSGRFEFRESHDRKFVIVALHNFRPALPWSIYIWTQAIVHKIVMRRFGAHLKKVDCQLRKRS